jgi:hypothetical protein
MSLFLTVLKKLVDKKFINYNQWQAIIEKADKETLIYLRDNARYGWKYFTRDDWMDPSLKADLFKRVAARIYELELHEWFY